MSRVWFFSTFCTILRIYLLSWKIRNLDLSRHHLPRTIYSYSQCGRDTKEPGGWGSRSNNQGIVHVRISANSEGKSFGKAWKRRLLCRWVFRRCLTSWKCRCHVFTALELCVNASRVTDHRVKSVYERNENRAKARAINFNWKHHADALPRTDIFVLFVSERIMRHCMHGIFEFVWRTRWYQFATKKLPRNKILPVRKFAPKIDFVIGTR